ncbi:auxin efflux carrier [Anaerohalosphaera lusitana]|uniref:Auxin efflux carrier n=1 Tax=Anaerohalosphaera lusitana TaxID=1936003 RepID=A0A1U9NKQ9_9BACT|nr:AEC family transporter [Anaerohalosphaera lusitana]AQT68395.1 auxin efflux carrier [Anaerohalosphaera lusitana]
MDVLNTIAPVFLVILTGYILTKKRFLSDSLVKDLNRICFWIALPALLFGKIVGSTGNFTVVMETFLVVTAGMVACLLGGFVLARLLKVPFTSVGTFVQGTYRGNLAFVGLAVIIYSLADFTPEHAQQVETLAVYVLAPIVPIYNLVAVFLLVAFRQNDNRNAALKKIPVQLASNPLVIACAAGFLVQRFLPSPPLAIMRTLDVLGQMALPLALLGVGGALAHRKIAGRSLYAISASLLKTVLAPAVGLLLAHLMGLSQDEMRVALIFLACPTAISSHTMAERMGGDAQLSAAIVIISSLLSILSLSAILAMFY